MRKATFRAMYVFWIPFLFIWGGSKMANAMNNIVFEIVLGIVMLVGVIIYWSFPFLVEMAIEYNLDEMTRTTRQQERLNRLTKLISERPRLKEKYGSMLEGFEN